MNYFNKRVAHEPARLERSEVRHLVLLGAAPDVLELTKDDNNLNLVLLCTTT
jgi:hypothetical protein